MDLPRYTALLDYWQEFPPVHVSMALHVGWGKGAKGKSPAQDEGDTESLMMSLPAVSAVGPGGK